MKIVGRTFVALDTLPVVMPEDANLVEKQFMGDASMSDAHTEPHALNVGWMLLNPGKPLPSMAKVKQFFEYFANVITILKIILRPGIEPGPTEWESAILPLN